MENTPLKHDVHCACHACTLERNKQNEVNQWLYRREVDREVEEESDLRQMQDQLLYMREGPDHQSAASSPLSSSEEEVPQDESSPEVPRTLVRLGRKEPRGPVIEISDDEEIVEHHDAYQTNFRKRIACDEEYPQEPDLAEYFAPFKMDKTQVIAMCRTYANHLAQQVRFRSANKKTRRYIKK